MSGDTCKCECGHFDTSHRCDQCSCMEYEAKEQPASEQWLDEVADDAYYWVHYPLFTSTVSKRNLQTEWLRRDALLSKGVRVQRIQEPTPPPAPLPAKRSVELTAEVGSGSHGDWTATVKAGLHILAEQELFRSRHEAADWCRKGYGIEPVVVDGGAS